MIGERTDDGDALGRLKREDAVVLEQNHRFVGDATRKVAVCWAVKLLLVDVHVGHRRGRIEHAETDAGREKTKECGIDEAFGKIPLLHGFDVWLVIVIITHFSEIDTFVIHAADHRDR